MGTKMFKATVINEDLLLMENRKPSIQDNVS